MDHQTLRVCQSQEDINSADQKDYLQQFYYTMPGQPLPNPARLGVRLAPLAKFDEKDFDLPMAPYEAKHKVKLFKALLIFFSTVIMLVGLASSAFGVYYILDKERVQMHQVILVNLQDIKDMMTSQAQPVLYFLSLALIGSGFLMALIGLLTLFSASKEHLGLISLSVVLFTLLFAAQLTLGFFSISFHLRSHEDLREELVTRLRIIYNEPGGEFFSPALDYVQTKFKCCGIVNDDDYNQSHWRKEALGGEDLIYPLTCCSLKNANNFEAFLNPMVKNQDKCMSPDIRLHGQHRHTQGCLEDILDWSTLEFVVIIAISIGCSVIEIMSVCVSMYLIKHLRKKMKTLDS